MKTKLPNIVPLDTARIDPQVQAIFSMLPPEITNLIITKDNLAEFRNLADQLMPQVAFESDFATRDKINIAGGEIEVYHYQPIQKTDYSKSALLWIHGGGYIYGSAMDDGYVLPIIQQLGCQVFSVEYRLAPEHPFPAGHSDCLAAYKWLHDNAESFGINNSKVAIGGISAGGGMTAGLALKIRDEGLPTPTCQLLRCPMIDNLNETVSSRVTGYPLWKMETNINAWEMYLNGSPGKGASQYAAAARAESVDSLPPTLIAVGAEDVFADENKTYADRLRSANVPVEFTMYPGVVHGAESMAKTTDVVQKMDAQVISFLKKYL